MKQLRAVELLQATTIRGTLCWSVPSASRTFVAGLRHTASNGLNQVDPLPPRVPEFARVLDPIADPPIVKAWVRLAGPGAHESHRRAEVETTFKLQEAPCQPIRL